MHSDTITRRRTLALLGTSAVVPMVGCGGKSDAKRGWVGVDAPADGALYDAVITANGPRAVGEDGRILARGTEGWTRATERSSDDPFHGAAVTADGRRLWACGGSGVIVALDVPGGDTIDRSAPKGKTSSWTDVAVLGRRGRERLLLVNSSGELLVGEVDGATVAWGQVTKPTGGDAATAVAVTHAAASVTDGDADVFRLTGSGGGGEASAWQRIGLATADASIHDATAPGGVAISVVTEDGSVYSYDGYRWFRDRPGDAALHAVERSDGRGVAVGVQGTVTALSTDGWTVESTPTDRTLHGCALGSVNAPAVAVGADGVVLERYR